MTTLRAITKIDEVLPYVWNIVFELGNQPFQYTTDLLYLHESHSWVVSRRIPHELTSMLLYKNCPLCNHDGISCSEATKEVENIIKMVLQDESFREVTSERIQNDTEKTYEQYQFVNNKTEWSKLYEANKI